MNNSKSRTGKREFPLAIARAQEAKFVKDMTQSLRATPRKTGVRARKLFQLKNAQKALEKAVRTFRGTFRPTGRTSCHSAEIMTSSGRVSAINELLRGGVDLHTAAGVRAAQRPQRHAALQQAELGPDGVVCRTAGRGREEEVALRRHCWAGLGRRNSAKGARAPLESI